MAKDETKRLSPAVIEADRSSFAALQSLTNYTPANTTYSLAAMTAAQSALAAAQAAETQANAAAAAARDTAVNREWEFHNLVLGMKDQVIAQFGRDSNEVQAVGLKKASEYRARTRREAKPQT